MMRQHHSKKKKRCSFERLCEINVITLRQIHLLALDPFVNLECFMRAKCTSVCTYTLINELECLFSRLPLWLHECSVLLCLFGFFCACAGFRDHVHASVYSCCMCQKAKTNTVCQLVCQLLRWLMWTQTSDGCRGTSHPWKTN